MLRIFTTLLFCSSCLSPAMADDIDFDSSVGKVTVFPQGAEVTRMATGNIPAGEHVIIIDDLPGQVVPESVRVEGSSAAIMAIGSVDVRQVYVSDKENPEKRLKVEREIERLRDDVAALDQQARNAEFQRTMLQNMAGRAVIPRRKDGNALVISAAELSELLSITTGKLEQISASMLKMRIEKRSISKKILELQQKLAELSPRQELKTVVAVNLTADQQSEADFRIRYNIYEAGWSPVYDARLTLGKKGVGSKLLLVRRAEVHQSSTDDWKDISLTLSTARPSGSTTAPVLSSYILGEIRPVPLRANLRRKLSKSRPRVMADKVEAEMMEAPAGAAAPVSPHKITRKQVVAEFAGFLAEYKIPGQVSVSNAGENKSVTIGEEDFDVKIAAHAVPKLDPTAYLTAKFTIKSKVPYLPGTVMLSRDGVFLGQGELPLLNAGEEHALGFGRDDFVKISRAQVTKKTSESGFISTANVEERKFITTIKNLHDFPMLISVEDNIPYATHEDISIEMLSGLTRPSKKNVDNRRGIVLWETSVDGGGEKIIKFGYKVSWPKKMKITPVR